MSASWGMEAAGGATPACLAVIPLLVGPLQVLLALLPAVLVTLASAVLALFRPSTFRLGLRLLWRMRLSLLALGAILFALAHAVRWVRPASAGTRADRLEVTGDYPMYRGGPQRLGVEPGSPEPLSGGINWRFDQDRIAVFSTPAVAGNRVYFSTADFGFRFNRGSVHCLDADTGELIWKTTPPGMRAAVSSPSVSGKYLVVGEGFHETQDACVFCLDVTRRGQLLWRHRTRNHVETTPCIANGRVYVGAGDDGYYCLELEPDEDGRARVVWHQPGHLFPDAETCPVVDDGKVFVGLGVGGNAVVCLDADTGRQLWRVPTPYPVFSPPTIHSNRVITAMGNGDYGSTAQQWASRAVERIRRRGGSMAEMMDAWHRLGPAGEVWCLDPARGEVRWRFRARDQIMGSIAADRGRLYFGSRDGYVYCLSLDGEEIARWNVREPILACAAVAPRTAYFVTEPGRLFALDRETFTRVWEVNLGPGGHCMGSPTVARGRVYVGTPQEGLLCVGRPGEPSRHRLWSGFLAGPGSPGGVDGSVPGESGRVSWTWNGGDSESGKPVVTAPPAVLNQRLFLPVSEGAGRGLVCWRVDRSGGSNPTPLWRAPLTNGVHRSPAANADAVFVVDGLPGQAGRHLSCFEAASGRLEWKLPLETSAGGEFALTRDGVLVQDATNRLTALDRHGRPIWRVPSGVLLGAPAEQDEMVFVATAKPPTLRAMDGPTGKTLWSVPVELRTGPVVIGRRLLAGTTTGVAAFAPANGGRLWHAAVGEPVAPLAANDQWIVSLNRSGKITLLDDRGITRGRLDGAVPSLAPVVVRDALVFATPQSLVLHRLRERISRPWLDTRPLGALTSPPVCAGSALFFATEAAGLVRADSAP